jgi:hypothetical protein
LTILEGQPKTPIVTSIVYGRPQPGGALERRWRGGLLLLLLLVTDESSSACSSRDFSKSVHWLGSKNPTANHEASFLPLLLLLPGEFSSSPSADGGPVQVPMLPNRLMLRWTVTGGLWILGLLSSSSCACILPIYRWSYYVIIFFFIFLALSLFLDFINTPWLPILGMYPSLGPYHMVGLIENRKKLLSVVWVIRYDTVKILLGFEIAIGMISVIVTI